MGNVQDALKYGASLIAVIAAVVAVLTVIGLFRSKQARDGKGLVRRLVVLAVCAALILPALFKLPGESEDTQLILGVIGLVVTTVITLSSTTFVTNAMAGLMLRSMRTFRPGDWVRVEEHLGIVTEQGVLHIEIQTENRDVVTLPNLYLITRPVQVVLGTGTIVSAELSLGYDLPHVKVEQLLVEAATETGLEHPFVRVRELGDYSVKYRVAGLLKDTLRLIDAQSRLCRNAMDALHGAKMEIVSPMFMNQRQATSHQPVIAKPAPPAAAAAAAAAEAKRTKPEDLFTLGGLVVEQRDLELKIKTLQKKATEAEPEEKERIAEQVAALEAKVEDVKERLAREAEAGDN